MLMEIPNHVESEFTFMFSCFFKARCIMVLSTERELYGIGLSSTGLFHFDLSGLIISVDHFTGMQLFTDPMATSIHFQMYDRHTSHIHL